MSTTATTLPPARRAAGPTRSLSHLLSVAIVVVVGILLVHVLVETWAQVLTGPTSEDPRVNLENAAQWPKQLKTLLYLTLAGLAVARVAVDRLWHRFRTGADLALVVLGLVMVLAGLVNDSSAGLMGQALFVYFRGVLVFYALRAADLEAGMVRRLLQVVAAVVGLNVLFALVQMVVGAPAYRALGWVDMTWAEQSRAQGLQPHPNHLGHLLGLTLLGFVAWVAVRPSVRPAWWAVAGVVALALSASQSRESLLGVLGAAVLIAILVRGSARRVLAVCLVLVLCTAAQIAARPDNRAEWERRVGNAFSGFLHPAGSEHRAAPATATGSPGKAAAPSASRSPSPRPKPSASRSASPKPKPSASRTASPKPKPSGGRTPAVTAAPSRPAASPSPAPVREIRVLYLQQAADILPRQPLLGFGIGQFGGVVAEKNNPQWHKNPKFGPKGFNRYGFQAVQIDSFWLHLTMEAGILGLIAFLVWLFFVVRPLLAATSRRRNPDGPPPSAPVVWGIAAMVFAGFVAFLSPAFEDPLLPALLWTIIGLAWWACRRSREEAASVYTAPTEMLSVIRRSGDTDARTHILTTDEILDVARRSRRPAPTPTWDDAPRPGAGPGRADDPGPEQRPPWGADRR
ncbi:O-antigen ligase family protein [Micromonospora mirobrigensis]|uniref:O-Antigen ligase n=1 Tax=Micromonospora mirobrigensis TaxID=262898 RepID=A0A1C4U9G1_9ACTN|nr:O-antigen ligase family protein [Micromonospora mirobrigensis]SCE68333.1 O-Antigen ligase [Micromonospora mirobrigensis]